MVSDPGRPLGLAPWLLLIIYCLFIISTGAGYYNWPPFSSLLYGSGAYEWLCRLHDGPLIAKLTTTNVTVDKTEDVMYEKNSKRYLTQTSDWFQDQATNKQWKGVSNILDHHWRPPNSKMSVLLASHLLSLHSLGTLTPMDGSTNERKLQVLSAKNSTVFPSLGNTNSNASRSSTHSSIDAALTSRRWGPSCNDQKIRLVQIYTFGFAISQFSGLISGVYMDWVGPRITAMTGQLLCGVGWLFLSLSSQTYQMYVPAMLCIGGSVSLTGLPGNWVAVLFPRNNAFVLSVISAAFDASFCVPLLLVYIWKFLIGQDASFVFLLGCYVWCIIFPMFIFSYFLFPKMTYGTKRSSDGKYSDIFTKIGELDVLSRFSLDQASLLHNSLPDSRLQEEYRPIQHGILMNPMSGLQCELTINNPAEEYQGHMRAQQANRICYCNGNNESNAAIITLPLEKQQAEYFGYSCPYTKKVHYQQDLHILAETQHGKYGLLSCGIERRLDDSKIVFQRPRSGSSCTGVGCLTNSCCYESITPQLSFMVDPSKHCISNLHSSRKKLLTSFISDPLSKLPDAWKEPWLIKHKYQNDVTGEGDLSSNIPPHFDLCCNASQPLTQIHSSLTAKTTNHKSKFPLECPEGCLHPLYPLTRHNIEQHNFLLDTSLAEVQQQPTGPDGLLLGNNCETCSEQHYLTLKYSYESSSSTGIVYPKTSRRIAMLTDEDFSSTAYEMKVKDSSLNRKDSKPVTLGSVQLRSPFTPRHHRNLSPVSSTTDIKYIEDESCHISSKCISLFGSLSKKEVVLLDTPVCYTYRSQRQHQRRSYLMNATFVTQFTSIEFCCFLVHFLLCSLRSMFINICARDVLGQQFGDLIGAMSPFACIPCLLFGYCVDIVGSIKTAFVLNTLGCLMVGLVLLLPFCPGLIYLAATVYVIHSSFVYGQMVVFVSEVFGLSNFGKFMGFATLVDGFMPIVNSFLYYLAVKIFQNNFLIINLGFQICTVFCFIPLAVLGASIGPTFQSEKQRKNSNRNNKNNLEKWPLFAA